MWYIADFFFRRRYKDIPFKIQALTDVYQSECREEIKKEIQKLTDKKDWVITRVRQKPAKLETFRFTTDLFGNRFPAPKPYFLASEIHSKRAYVKVYWFFLAILIVFETYFLSFFGSLILPPEINSSLAYLTVGFFFAATLGIILHFGLGPLFQWYEAKKLHEKYSEDLDGQSPAVSEHQVATFLPRYYIAVALLSLFVIGNLAAGLIRAFLLEPTSEMVDGPMKTVVQVAFPIFVVVIPFAIALVLAMAELRISSFRERLKSFEDFKKQFKELSEHAAALGAMHHGVIPTAEMLLEKYWQLILSAQMRLGCQVDQGREGLLAELEEDIRQNSVLDEKNLTESVYQKYSPISSARIELFSYPIISYQYFLDLENELKEWAEEAESLWKEFEKFETEYFGVLREENKESEASESDVSS